MALGLWIGRRVRGASRFFRRRPAAGPGPALLDDAGGQYRGRIDGRRDLARLRRRRRRVVVGRLGGDRLADPRAVDRPGDATGRRRRTG